jgi:SAM-dependent methyltransferase
MWTDPIILAIYRRWPARGSIFKPSEGRPELEYQRNSAAVFFGLFGYALQMVAGKDVLDLGSGFGSQAVQYVEAGANRVVGLEISEDKVRHSREFAAGRGVADRTEFVMGTGEELPFGDSSFDLVTMDDVLEHVVDPEAVLQESARVLRPGGRLLAAFPPYYCIYGGSHLEGYATRFPGMNLLFPTHALRSATTIFLEQEGVDWRSYLREVPTDKLWNQNGLTIRRLCSILARLPLEGRLAFIGLRDHRKASSRRSLPRVVLAVFELCARLPVLREALCSRVALELQRPLQASSSERPSSVPPRPEALVLSEE